MLITQAPVRHYASIDSTNIEAGRLLAGGEAGPLWLLADEQIAGRGRLERQWASPRGNCYSTLLLPLQTTMAVAPQIGFVVALAVADMVAMICNATPQLKWPNDVLVHDAKIAGILCEVVSAQPLVVAIGCGINVAHFPHGLPYPATCLASLGANPTRDDVFATYQACLEQRLLQWQEGQGFADIRKAWVAQAIGIGEPAAMTVANERLTGTFEGITDQGAVLLKTPHGQPHIIHAGDLHIPSLAARRNGTS